MAYEKGLLALFYPPKRGIASRECPGRSNSTVSCSTLCVKPKLPARLVECYSGSKGHIPHWLRTRIFFHFCFRVLDVSDLKLVRTECERVMWQSRPHSRKRRTSKGARNSAPQTRGGKTQGSMLSNLRSPRVRISTFNKNEFTKSNELLGSQKIEALDVFISQFSPLCVNMITDCLVDCHINSCLMIQSS